MVPLLWNQSHDTGLPCELSLCNFYTIWCLFLSVRRRKKTHFHCIVNAFKLLYIWLSHVWMKFEAQQMNRILCLGCSAEGKTYSFLCHMSFPKDIHISMNSILKSPKVQLKACSVRTYDRTQSFVRLFCSSNHFWWVSMLHYEHAWCFKFNTLLNLI